MSRRRAISPGTPNQQRKACPATDRDQLGSSNHVTVNIKLFLLFIKKQAATARYDHKFFATSKEETTMTLSPSILTTRFFRHIIQRQFPSIAPTKQFGPSSFQAQCFLRSSSPLNAFHKNFSTTSQLQATLNQVRRGCRSGQKARKKRSPALVNRPQLKGVCLKTQVEKPKKPNSGERKTARVKLSSGKVITAYIPGEGTGSETF